MMTMKKEIYHLALLLHIVAVPSVVVALLGSQNPSVNSITSTSTPAFFLPKSSLAPSTERRRRRNNNNSDHSSAFGVTIQLLDKEYGDSTSKLWAYTRMNEYNKLFRTAQGSRRNDRTRRGVQLPLNSTMEATTEQQQQQQQQMMFRFSTSPPDNDSASSFSSESTTANADSNSENDILMNNAGSSIEKNSQNDKNNKNRITSNIVALADAKIDKSSCPKDKYPLTSKMDAIFHASTLAQRQNFVYVRDNDNDSDILPPTTNTPMRVETEQDDDYNNLVAAAEVEAAKRNDERLVASLRKALQDAGFVRLQDRDLRLCEALNTGYLLRLSIAPDVSKLDSSIGDEFYPELNVNPLTLDSDDNEDDDEEEEEDDDDDIEEKMAQLLFDGKILVFRRGYSSETTSGRLLLPKFDYLQTSLVQRSSAIIARKVGAVERKLSNAISTKVSSVEQSIDATKSNVAEKIPSKIKEISTTVTSENSLNKKKKRKMKKMKRRERRRIKFERYGGRLTRFVGSEIYDSLEPFVIDQKTVAEGSANKTLYDDLLTGQLKSEYDNGESIDDEEEEEERSSPPLQLLERVSIANLVDFFSNGGRRRLIKSFISESKLVEPTYEEVVVVWRPLREKPKKKRLALPKFLYDVAEIFAIEDRLPKKELPEPEPKPLPIEIRAFDRVPMANLLAIFPKTKLVFRPADAFIFDLVSIFSLLAILASQKFDSPKLDLLAIVSVSLWFLRTFFRYSNKLARYDLLVNKFLTSRIAHRNEGAMDYVLDEAAKQRALRASLLHKWIVNEKIKFDDNMETLTKEHILSNGFIGMNQLIGSKDAVDIDVHAAVNDLTELQLIKFSSDGLNCIRVEDDDLEAERLLESKWLNIFQVM